MNLYEMSAAMLARKLRNKECSSQEITQSVLGRIQAVEGQVGAYITLTPEQALETAKQVDKRLAAGEKLAPLAGIPIGIKDNICTKDVVTTCASKMLHNFVPPYSAYVVRQVERAGMPILGKLNMDEFAMGSSCENSHYKKTKNPRDLTRVPGGSSGGSAAAVTAGEAILALGSDTGGSIRQPAAYCGTVGLKPTYGSVSRYGLVAFASSLDQIGPLGRTVEDVAMLYSLISGYDPKDATSVNRTYTDFVAGLNDFQVNGLKIGIPKEYFGDGVDQEIKEKVLAAIKLLEKNGAEVKEISLPSTDYALSAYYIIACAEASSNLARFDGVKYGYRSGKGEGLTEMYEYTRREGFGDEVKRRIMLGTFVLSSGYIDAYYKKAKATQAIIADEFRAAFEQVDLIMTPTAPDTAFRIGERSADPLKMYLSDICTVTVNIAGLPALSVPCGEIGRGLPVGLQMIAPHFGEDLLFKAAHYYEKISGLRLADVAAL